MARRQSEEGFNLIELMIVLVIIGVLVSVALPRLYAMRQRAQMSEVHANVPAVLLAQRAYLAEQGAFTDNLYELAWRPEGAPRYIIGFVSDAVPAASGLNDSVELYAGGYTQIDPSNLVDAFGLPLTEVDLPATAVAGSDRLIIGASGNVDADATLDQWEMSHEGKLRHVVNDAQ